jgi:futalosine hydrolase
MLVAGQKNHAANVIIFLLLRVPKILLHSATAAEIEPTLAFLKAFPGHEKDQYKFGNTELDLCVSGAGMVKTAFELGKFSGISYDIAIQAGIGGTFGLHGIGDLVRIEEDCFSELGAENGDVFLRIDDLKLGEQQVKLMYPHRHKLLEHLPKAKGITVNTVHGNEQSIQRLLHRQKAEVESMEGAAFIYAANRAGWPAVQLRCISNRVEKRNRSKWDIPGAIHNLNLFLLQFLNALDEN